MPRSEQTINALIFHAYQMPHTQWDEIIQAYRQRQRPNEPQNSATMNLDEIIHKIGNSEELVGFATTPARIFILIAQLQLALRHPENTGSSAAIAYEIAQNLSKAVCHHIPEAAELIDMGWHQEFDVTRQYFDEEFEGDRLPRMNQDDPNRPGVGDQF